MEQVEIFGTNRIDDARGELSLLVNHQPDGTSETCRLCLETCTSADQRWALFPGDMPQKLMAFAAVQIQEHDGLPRIICTNCRDLVYMSYNFKCQVEKCDHYLRHTLLIKQSTNHWSEAINTIESLVPCAQKNIINSCMVTPNEESSTNNQEQFIFEITNTCNMSNSNNTFQPNIIVERNNIVSQGIDNISSESHNTEGINITFKAHFSVKDEQSDKNSLIRKELLTKKENGNQSDDEKPLILRTKRHKCKYCIKSFANLTLLEKHAVIHKKQSETMFNCYICDEQFLSVDKVQSHALSIHNIEMDKDKIIDCNKQRRKGDFNSRKICDDSNSNESNISLDNTEHKKSRPFMCKMCPKQFAYHKTFIAHIRTHPNYSDYARDEVNEIPETISEIVDEEVDLQSQNLENNSQVNLNDIENFMDRNNMYMSEDENNDFDEDDSSDDDGPNDDNIPASGIQCNQCGKLVATMRNLKRHLLTHSGLKYNCSLCCKDFSRPDKLREHQQLKHKEELFGKSDSDDESIDEDLPTRRKKDKKNRPHKCPMCPKAFAQAQSLANHEERHKRVRDVQKRYLCEVCSKCFAQSGSLVAHMRTHTGVKPYVCNVCNRAFTKSTYLQLHLRTHSGEKPYICQYCSRAFARANTLARHITMHTGEAKYQCQICSKSFRRLTSLNEHTYTHTGQRPYACKMCSKRYNNAGSLYAHTKKCKGTPSTNSISEQACTQQNDNDPPPQSDADAAHQVLIFTEKTLDETAIDDTVTPESSCQFMITNVHDQKAMSTNMLESFSIEEPHVYDLNSKQFKTPFYGLYPSM